MRFLRVFAAALAAAVLVCAGEVDGLDPLVERAMAEWKVPGLAVAVVKDGRVIHLKGYGFRDVEQQKPVTATTVFGIGSISKSFTALLLHSLAAEDKLDLHKPVREYAPFVLADPVASAQATLTDLMSHRTGLPRHDLVWLGTSLTRPEIFDRLRFLEPSKGFRESYQYNNLMFLAAGHVAERVTGASWDSLVRGRLFQPMGMTSANTSVRDSEKLDDVAQNYGGRGDAQRRLPFREIDGIAPAGSINASIEDMARYLRMHLGDGTLDGVEIAKPSALRAMRTGVTPMPMPQRPGYDGYGPQAYGQGLMISTYRGRVVISHTGTIGGYHALMTYLPDQKLGVVTLQNRVARSVPPVIASWTFDKLLGVEPLDRIGAFKEMDRTAEEAEARERKESEAKRKPGTQPSRPLDAYAGKFRHPAYETVEVELTGGKLIARRNGVTAEMTHFHFDVFQWNGMKAVFSSNADGEIDRLELPLEPAVKPIAFTRVR